MMAQGCSFQGLCLALGHAIDKSIINCTDIIIKIRQYTLSEEMYAEPKPEDMNHFYESHNYGVKVCVRLSGHLIIVSQVVFGIMTTSGLSSVLSSWSAGNWIEISESILTCRLNLYVYLT